MRTEPWLRVRTLVNYLLTKFENFIIPTIFCLVVVSVNNSRNTWRVDGYYVHSLIVRNLVVLRVWIFGGETPGISLFLVFEYLVERYVADMNKNDDEIRQATTIGTGIRIHLHYHLLIVILITYYYILLWVKWCNTVGALSLLTSIFYAHVDVWACIKVWCTWTPTVGYHSVCDVQTGMSRF